MKGHPNGTETSDAGSAAFALACGRASPPRLLRPRLSLATPSSTSWPRLNIYMPWEEQADTVAAGATRVRRPAEWHRTRNQIAGLALANAKRWGVLHVIWRQGFYPGVGAPSWTADYGNETANHFDHVHIATDGGRYPTGNETYFLDSMRAAPQG